MKNGDKRSGDQTYLFYIINRINVTSYLVTFIRILQNRILQNLHIYEYYK